MGNQALHSAEEPVNLRATTGTVEVPTERDNDAALALGARPIQQHEPVARHVTTGRRNRMTKSLEMTARLKLNRKVLVATGFHMPQ